MFPPGSSELKKEQMVKSYKGVKSGRGCEGVTVSCRCAADGASINLSINLWPSFAQGGSRWFLWLSQVLKRGTKGLVQLQIKVSFEIGGLI